MRVWRYFEVKFLVVLLGGVAMAWGISGFADNHVPGAGQFVFWFALVFPLSYLAGLVVGAYRAHRKPANGRSNKMRISEQPNNRKTYICQHVFDCSRDMKFVHYDGDIQILCNFSDCNLSNPDEIHVVGLGHLTARDPTLLEIPELHSGAWAERSESDRRWQVFNNDNR